MKNPKKTIMVYLTILFLRLFSYALVLSTYQLYLQDVGLSMVQMTIIISIPFFTIFVFEIPTGAYADLFGRKQSYLVSCILPAISMLIYYLTSGFWSFVLAEILAGIGFTFASGSLEAWMVDSLKAEGYNDKIDSIFARGGIAMKAGNILGGFFGAFVAGYSLALPRLFSALILLITFLFTLVWMKEDTMNGTAGKFSVIEGLRSIRRISRDSIMYGIGNPTVFLLIIIGLVTSLAAAAPGMWQTLFSSKNEVSIDTFGWLWVLLSLSSMVGNYLVKYLSKLDRINVLIFTSITKIVTMALVIYFAGFWGSFTFFLLSLSTNGLSTPLEQGLLHEHIPAEKRTTVLSFYSMFAEVGGGFGFVVFGLISENLSMGFAWLAFALVLLINIPIYWRLKVLPSTRSVTEGV